MQNITLEDRVEYRLEGKLHRVEGPAVEWADGAREWWENGQRHRVGGPAVEWADGSRSWWENGVQIPEPTLEREFEEEIRKTEAEDLIYKTPLEPGSKYLLCSFSEDHVLDYGFMTQFAKTRDIARIKCPYCQNKVVERVFIQE